MQFKNLMKPIFKGVVFAVAFTLLLSVCAAGMIVRGILPPQMTTLLPPFVIGVSLFTSILSSLFQVKNNRMIAAFLVATIYFCITVLAKVMCFPGTYDLCIRNSLAILIAALIAFLVCTTRKKRNTIRYYLRGR